jgi:hypothetical protein
MLKNKRKLLIIVGVAVLLIILVICIVAALNGGSRRGTPVTAETPPTTAATTAGNTTQAITTTEEPVTEPPYVPIKFTDDMYPLRRDGMYGVVNENGDVIVGFMYSYIEPEWVNGLAQASGSGGIGFIDANDRTIIPLEYKKCTGFSDGLYVLTGKDVCDAYDEMGNLILRRENTTAFDYLGSLFSDGLAAVYAYKYPGYRGFIDLDKNVAIECQFDEIYPDQFTSGVIGVKVDQAWGVINTRGEYVVPLSKENYAIVWIGPKNILMHKASGGTDVLDLEGNLLHHSTADLGFSRSSHNPSKNVFSMHNGDAFACVSYGPNCFAEICDTSGRLLASTESLGVTTLGISKASEKWLAIDSNYLSVDGKLLWKDESTRYNPYSTSYWPEGLVHYYLPDTGTHRILDFNGNILLERKAELDYFNVHYTASREGGQWATKLLSLEGGPDYKFGNVNVCNRRAAIVQDEAGAYYGIFVMDKMKFPMEYNEIRYDEQEETFTLTKGTDISKVFIARNGRVIEL